MAQNNLYDKVVSITHTHLGTGADRFVARQIRNHLQKDPADLTPHDLKRLLDWIQVAMRIATDNDHDIDRYIAELRVLSARHGHTRHGNDEKVAHE